MESSKMAAEAVQKKITSFFGTSESNFLVQEDKKKDENIYMRALSRKLETARAVVSIGDIAASNVEVCDKVFSLAKS